MYRKIGIITALLLFVSGTVVADDFFGLFSKKKRGSGDKKTISLDLDAFERIETDCSADFKITIGDKQQVHLTFDDNLLEDIHTDIRGGTLKVSMRNSISYRGKCLLEMTIPSLEYLYISGSSDVDIYEFKGSTFSLKISGSGDVTMSGEVDDLKIRISGSGDVNCRDLMAKDAQVKISGSGDVELYASNSFDGSVTGSGDVTVFGNPKDFDRSISGSGSIRKR